MIRPLLVFLTLAAPLRADQIDVVTDIAPIHGLASMVMQGVATPGLIIDAGADPHHMAMRPSAGRALQGADLVIWMGPQMTPWLGEWIGSAAPDGAQIQLLSLPQTHLLAVHDDDEEEEEDHDDIHKHDHGGLDPHAWLDHENAVAWIHVIAQQLAQMDADNAPTYLQNASEAVVLIITHAAMAKGMIQNANPGPLVAEHDGLGYFAHAFDLDVVGTITDADDTPPSPAHLRELQELITDHNVTCALTQTGSDRRLMDAAFDGRPYHYSGVSLMGTGLNLGADYYPTLLTDLARAVATCKAS